MAFQGQQPVHYDRACLAETALPFENCHLLLPWKDHSPSQQPTLMTLVVQPRGHVHYHAL